MAPVSYELTPCPVCGSGDGAQLADADQIRAEVERLWEFHEARLRKGVPAERLTDRLAFAQHPPIRIAYCVQCSHVYRNPWERKEALTSAYADAPPDREVMEGLFETQRKTSRRQAERLLQVTGRPGRGLEVGSYAGGFLAAANEQGWSFEGLDLSEEVCGFARDKGLRMTRGELEEFDPAAPFDAITIWNTFEQVYDARGTLQAARRLLGPQGVLALRFPNGGFYRAWRARLNGPMTGIALRLLVHNNLLGFPYRQGYTQSSLTCLLHQCGFRIVRHRGDTLARVADQWTTRYGALEERWVKRLERRFQRGWSAPWVEVYARLD